MPHAQLLALSLALPLAIAGCASRQTDPTLGTSRDLPRAPDPETDSERQPISKLPPDIVARAAMPFTGLRTDDGTRLSQEDLMKELAAADLVCVGEDHDNPHHHWAELRVVRGLLARAPMKGRELGVGLEMIQRPYQAPLDDYLEWEIDEVELVEGVEWHERWGYDWAYYRPVLELARAARFRVLALNAPRELTKQVASEGLGGLDEEAEKQLPELELGDAEHRAWFERATRGHPHHGEPDDLYAAQVVWDETMAETAANWLKQRAPLRQLVVLAGAGHCRDDAIPARVRRRIANAKTASVRPVVQRDDSAPATALDGFDYGFVMSPPDPRRRRSSSTRPASPIGCCPPSGCSRCWRWRGCFPKRGARSAGAR